MLLTVIVGIVGVVIYIALSWLSRSKELYSFAGLIFKKKQNLEGFKKEMISPVEQEE
jgi:hypothetical protein